MTSPHSTTVETDGLRQLAQVVGRHATEVAQAPMPTATGNGAQLTVAAVNAANTQIRATAAVLGARLAGLASSANTAASIFDATEQQNRSEVATVPDTIAPNLLIPGGG